MWSVTLKSFLNHNQNCLLVIRPKTIIHHLVFPTNIRYNIKSLLATKHPNTFMAIQIKQVNNYDLQRSKTIKHAHIAEYRDKYPLT